MTPALRIEEVHSTILQRCVICCEGEKKYLEIKCLMNVFFSRQGHQMEQRKSRKLEYLSGERRKNIFLTNPVEHICHFPLHPCDCDVILMNRDGFCLLKLVLLLHWWKFSGMQPAMQKKTVIRWVAHTYLCTSDKKTKTKFYQKLFKFKVFMIMMMNWDYNQNQIPTNSTGTNMKS